MRNDEFLTILADFKKWIRKETEVQNISDEDDETENSNPIPSVLVNEPIENPDHISDSVLLQSTFGDEFEEDEIDSEQIISQL